MSNIRTHDGTQNPDGRPKGSSNSAVTCPHCGREFENLPNHIPCSSNA